MLGNIMNPELDLVFSLVLIAAAVGFGISLLWALVARSSGAAGRPAGILMGTSAGLYVLGGVAGAAARVEAGSMADVPTTRGAMVADPVDPAGVVPKPDNDERKSPEPADPAAAPEPTPEPAPTPAPPSSAEVPADEPPTPIEAKPPESNPRQDDLAAERRAARAARIAKRRVAARKAAQVAADAEDDGNDEDDEDEPAATIDRTAPPPDEVEPAPEAAPPAPAPPNDPEP